MKRKYEQVKTYAKIMKYKRKTGQFEEVQLAEKQKQPESNIIQEEHPEDVPNNEDFEDAFEDQYEEEEGWISQSDEEEEEGENQSGTMMTEGKQTKKQEKPATKEKNQIFLGSNKMLGRGEILQFDNRAYDMLHRLNVQWPSMSIDFVAKDSPFDTLLSYQQMTKYPYQVFTVQGSCNGSSKNSIYFTKWAKLHQTKFDDDPQGGNDLQDENNDQDPEAIVQQIQTAYDVNRLRTLNNSPIVAFWNDNGVSGEIRILDLSSNLEKLRNNIGTKKREKCKEIIISCEAAGYGICWNPHKIGELIAGDNRGVVSVYNNNQNYTQWTRTSQYTYHNGSVEDIVFSPEQSFVFASCSSDGTLQLVDMRAHSYKKAQLKLNAHKKDVNVCDWNRTATHLIATGGDDCQVKVWDLRMAQQGNEDELLCFNWHTEPITSLKFQPNDESVLAVASQDNRLTIWDMAVENEEEDPQVPNELMFLHQGQEEIKQLTYHPVYFQMIISTSLDAINIFKPAFEMPELPQDQKNDQQDLKRPPIREEDLDKYIERMSLE